MRSAALSQVRVSRQLLSGCAPFGGIWGIAASRNGVCSGYITNWAYVNWGLGGVKDTENTSKSTRFQCSTVYRDGKFTVNGAVSGNLGPSEFRQIGDAQNMATEWAPVKRQTAAGPWPAETSTRLYTPSAAA